LIDYQIAMVHVVLQVNIQDDAGDAVVNRMTRAFAEDDQKIDVGLFITTSKIASGQQPIHRNSRARLSQHLGLLASLHL
jgi:hypothetical protein